jgi:hypothetical protein
MPNWKEQRKDRVPQLYQIECAYVKNEEVGGDAATSRFAGSDKFPGKDELLETGVWLLIREAMRLMWKGLRFA